MNTATMNTMKKKVLLKEFPFLSNQTIYQIALDRAFEQNSVNVSRIDEHLLFWDWASDCKEGTEINSPHTRIRVYGVFWTEISSGFWDWKVTKLESPIICSDVNWKELCHIVIIKDDFEGAWSGFDDVEEQFSCTIYKPFKRGYEEQVAKAKKMLQTSLKEDEAKDLIYRLKWEYPTNQAGGTGSWNFKIYGDRIDLITEPYGCNYNEPCLEVGEHNKMIFEELKDLGYTVY